MIRREPEPVGDCPIIEAPAGRGKGYWNHLSVAARRVPQIHGHAYFLTVNEASIFGACDTMYNRARVLRAHVPRHSF